MDLSTKLSELLHHPKIDPHLTKLESITHLKRENILLITTVSLLAALIVSSWLSILCTALGLVIPSIKSIKALNTNTNLDHWMKYWMIYASLSLFDSFHFIPYYDLIKVLFLIYISISTSAVDYIFSSYIGPATNEMERLITPYLPQSILQQIEEKKEE